MEGFEVFNANLDWTCDGCKDRIKAGTNYLGQTGTEWGKHFHFGCQVKQHEV